MTNDYKTNKIVIVINGKAEVGKDTVCDFIIKNYFAEKISSITPILEIARNNGWDGVKDKKSRKFLSDLKRAYIDFNDLPNSYLVKEFNRFIESKNNILFVHIRESDQIENFISSIKDSCVYSTLLVCREKDESFIFWGNNSDDCADNYNYEYKYNNNKNIEDAEKDFLIFFQKLLQEKNINLQKKTAN